MRGESTDPAPSDVAAMPANSAAAPSSSEASWLFGSAALALLLVQLGTGLLLMLHFRPDPPLAWQDLFDLRQSESLSIVHELHFWASRGVMVLVLLHLFRAVLLRAYRQVRRFSWTLSLLLMLLILALAWTGHQLATPLLRDKAELLWIYVAHIAFLPLTVSGLLVVHLRRERRNTVSDEEA